MTTTDTPADLTIRYTPGDGVTLDGSTRGDGVYDVLRTLGLNWRGMRDGSGTLYIRGSRDKDIARYRSAIDRTRTALEAAGRTVEVEVEDGFRTAEQRRADADARAVERAELLRTRAERAEAASNAAREASRAIGDGMPLGEPIKVGHHSERRHRRDFERIDSHERKRFELADKATRLADRAAGVESHATHRNDPRVIMRRIDKLESDRRGYARSLAGYTRNFKRPDGSLYARDEFPPAADTRADDLRRWDARDAEEIKHLRAQLAELAAAGVFSAWGPDDFQAGDHANVGGRWCTVARVNRKSVSVYARWEWDTAESRATPVKWDDIHGRRRDGLQWDAPHADPWPVELARKVSRWRDLVARSFIAHQHPHGSDERRDARHVHDALHIVHGLPTNAPDPELNAIVDSLPDDAAEKRARAAAYLAVWERLHAGERAADIAATVTPITGTPAWRLPTDREPVDRRASELVPGDLVAGFYDTGFAGSRPRLLTGWCGPVVYVSPVRDRRESGEWITVRLADGEDREMKSWRRVAVFPADGGTPTEPVQPTPDPDPAPADPWGDLLATDPAPAAITTPDPVRCVTGGTRRDPEGPDASGDTAERGTADGAAWAATLTLAEIRQALTARAATVEAGPYNDAYTAALAAAIDPANVATHTPAAVWQRLPLAARQECARLDHGTFRCPHHAEPYPPYVLPQEA